MTDTKTLTNEDVQKLDFLIYGMKEGKFDDMIRKVEFKSRLSGNFDLPHYIGSLLERISTLEQDNQQLLSTVESLESQISSLSSFQNSCQGDMQDIAKALFYLFNPDPLGQSYELGRIDQFISKHGGKSY